MIPIHWLISIVIPPRFAVLISRHRQALFQSSFDFVGASCRARSLSSHNSHAHGNRDTQRDFQNAGSSVARYAVLEAVRNACKALPGRYSHIMCTISTGRLWNGSTVALFRRRSALCSTVGLECMSIVSRGNSSGSTTEYFPWRVSRYCNTKIQRGQRVQYARTSSPGIDSQHWSTPLIPP